MNNLGLHFHKKIKSCVKDSPHFLWAIFCVRFYGKEFLKSRPLSLCLIEKPVVIINSEINTEGGDRQ